MARLTPAAPQPTRSPSPPASVQTPAPALPVLSPARFQGQPRACSGTCRCLSPSPPQNPWPKALRARLTLCRSLSAQPSPAAGSPGEGGGQRRRSSPSSGQHPLPSSLSRAASAPPEHRLHRPQGHPPRCTPPHTAGPRSLASLPREHRGGGRSVWIALPGAQRACPCHQALPCKPPAWLGAPSPVPGGARAGVPRCGPPSLPAPQSRGGRGHVTGSQFFGSSALGEPAWRGQSGSLGSSASPRLCSRPWVRSSAPRAPRASSFWAVYGWGQSGFPSSS